MGIVFLMKNWRLSDYILNGGHLVVTKYTNFDDFIYYSNVGHSNGQVLQIIVRTVSDWLSP